MKQVTLKAFAAAIEHVTRSLRLKGADQEWAGLLVHSALERWDYEATPRNSITFASTGGDGVHYGYLHVDSEKRDDSPIVMTVPMAFDRPNIVVAETFTEFVAIGCGSGWFALEQLAYHPKWTVDLYGHESSDRLQSRALKALRKRLGVEWVPLSLKRLTQLKRKYGDKIALAPKRVGKGH